MQSSQLSKLGLSSESPELISMRLSDKVEPQQVNSYMLSEIVKTQKHANDLQDVVEEKFSMLEKALTMLSDKIDKQSLPRLEKLEKEKLSDGRQVTLTLHGNTIKSSAVSALGATIERPISNALNGFYSPISSGTYGVLIGLLAMGLTHKNGGGYKQWIAQGYFIGGFSQMIQDLFSFVATTYNIGLPPGL